MDFPSLLAQDPTNPVAVRAAKRLLERLFERYPPEISIPVFVAGVVLFALIFERVVVGILRKLTARTETTVDDALAANLPLLLRPLVVLIALHILIDQFLRNEADVTKLSPEGELASKTLTAIAIVVFALCFTVMALRMIDAWVKSDEHRVPVGPTLKLSIKVVMVPLAVIAALDAVNYPVTSLITALGIGSLAVGLALQDTLKNMFAGIQLVLDRPIRAGDFVDIDKTARGTVLEIGLRSTKLRSAENNTIIIPNSTIAGAVITNLDYADKSYYQSFQIAVAYGTDTRRAQTLLENVANAAKTDIAAIAEEPARVTIRELGESGITFTVDVRFRQWAGRLPLITEMYHRFHAALAAEGIEIPFPTRTIHLHREPPKLPTSAASPASP